MLFKIVIFIFPNLKKAYIKNIVKEKATDSTNSVAFCSILINKFKIK